MVTYPFILLLRAIEEDSKTLVIEPVTGDFVELIWEGGWLIKQKHGQTVRLGRRRCQLELEIDLKFQVRNNGLSSQIFLTYLVHYNGALPAFNIGQQNKFVMELD